jgi:hypothetical protein
MSTECPNPSNIITKTWEWFFRTRTGNFVFMAGISAAMAFGVPKIALAGLHWMDGKKLDRSNHIGHTVDTSLQPTTPLVRNFGLKDSSAFFVTKDLAALSANTFLSQCRRVEITTKEGEAITLACWDSNISGRDNYITGLSTGMTSEIPNEAIVVIEGHQYISIVGQLIAIVPQIDFDTYSQNELPTFESVPVVRDTLTLVNIFTLSNGAVYDKNTGNVYIMGLRGFFVGIPPRIWKQLVTTETDRQKITTAMINKYPNFDISGNVVLTVPTTTGGSRYFVLEGGVTPGDLLVK